MEDSRIVAYMAHDPVGNCEGQVTDFDPEVIRAAADAGIVFVALHEDGGRTVVGPEDVVEPEDRTEEYTFVAPGYVDTRLEAVATVFDALAAERTAAAEAEAGPAPAKARARASSPSFEEALEALREILREGAGK